MILGIDVGTTSVKVCIYCPKQKKIVARQAKDTQANVPSELGCEGNKQNPPKICSALHACVSRLPKDILKQVTCIGVCGQMHGVMLWSYSNSDSQYDDGQPWQKSDNDSSRFDVNPDKVSSLYTWQDNRCDPEFLAALPKPQSHLRACSGYGCTTLFWFAKNRPEKLEKFNCAGTIQDFVVAMLCNLKKPIMSVQNAASWGYFDTSSSQWNLEILESAGFPVIFLPEVIQSGALAGNLSEIWHGIPAGTPVERANMEFVPYFNGKYLAVAASLNGGNALATFISTLQQWSLELGSSLPQSTLWERSIQSASKCQTSSLNVSPKLLGERHAPNELASVSNINPGNLSLGHVFRAICAGIVKNLYSIMPRSVLVENNISRILGIGSALSRNQVLQEEVKSLYQLPIVFEGKGDAALGAALATLLMSEH
ncbi:sedoheptulokinase-like isoform X2 [Rhodnius prolixus]|uniref:sedoheptulokinase-like isoform X2 n=1 Tax=Rhodnius prolixus TaxID=13249 RepID=UPI003D18D826